MKPIPNTENPLVLRTDFSDQGAWDTICSKIRKPVGLFRFRANVEFLDDLVYDGINKEQLLELLPKNYNHSFIFVVDQKAISSPGYPVLVLDLFERTGHEFRTLPSQIQGIENNLSIANMDFEEFARAVDGRGIFRGFRRR
jgi:hypothetical protein